MSMHLSGKIYNLEYKDASTAVDLLRKMKGNGRTWKDVTREHIKQAIEIRDIRNSLYRSEFHSKDGRKEVQVDVFWLISFLVNDICRETLVLDIDYQLHINLWNRPFPQRLMAQELQKLAFYYHYWLWTKSSNKI